MSHAMKHALAAGLSGVLFGAGLLISGMTDPNKVLGFLDVFGAWDASLLFVMVGAIGVHALGYRLIRRRSAPLFADAFSMPAARDIDAKLLVGAAVFGIGWGLGGYCPGPAVVSLASLRGDVVAFVGGMVLGMFITARLESGRARRDAQHSPQPLAAA
jgi:uncharacterized membrane protein YedE/YeeE